MPKSPNTVHAQFDTNWDNSDIDPKTGDYILSEPNARISRTTPKPTITTFCVTLPKQRVLLPAPLTRFAFGVHDCTCLFREQTVEYLQQHIDVHTTINTHV